MAGQNVLGVLYVRLRIADTHERAMSRMTLLWGHSGVLVVMILAASQEAIPWLAVIPFIGYLARAVWAAARSRPVANIKRFGFTEIGVEILGGTLVVAGYWLF